MSAGSCTRREFITVLTTVTRCRYLREESEDYIGEVIAESASNAFRVSLEESSNVKLPDIDTRLSLYDHLDELYRLVA